MTYFVILCLYNGVCNDEIDFVSNKPGTETRILFGVPSKDGYGIRIGVLKKSREGENNDDVYTWLEWKYENFEDASKSFFDGKH